MSALRIDDDGPVRLVTISRPEARNAVDREVADGLYEAFRDFEGSVSLRVLVLTGAGGHFCSGADLKAISKGRGTRVEPGDRGPLGPTRLELSKPTIAAVEGYAVAGGLELALMCDLRVGAESSKFGVLNRRWGVPLIDGGTVRLPAIVGRGRALDMILTGRVVEGAEALSMGLINRLVDDGSALAEALSLAQAISRSPWACVVSDRQSVYDSAGLALREALQVEHEIGSRVIFDPDTAAGVLAFVEGEGRGGSAS